MSDDIFAGLFIGVFLLALITLMIYITIQAQLYVPMICITLAIATLTHLCGKGSI